MNKLTGVLVLALILAIPIYAYTAESKQAAPSSESEWLEWFNSLSSEDQDHVNFRPSRAVNEDYPVETSSKD